MSSFLNKTQSLVNKAQDAQDLIHVLNHIPIENLKGFINDKLQLMNQNKIRQIYFDSESITNIIADDVIQSIINYIPYQKSIKYINKAFNKFVTLNNDLRMRLRNREILSHFKNKNTWIVDSKRNHLTSEEIQKGIKGPIKSLDEALNKMESGDKILLSKGIHQVKNNFSFHKKDIQIEGIEKGCVLHEDIGHEDIGDECYVNQKLSLSNLSLEDCPIRVTGGNAWLTNCVVKDRWVDIDCSDSDTSNITLDCMRCMFIGNGVGFSAIGVFGSSTLCVTECIFDNCGGHDYDPAIRIHDTKYVCLKIIGNTFQNLSTNSCTSPIGGDEGHRINVKIGSIVKQNLIDVENTDILYHFLNH